ncbi:MAG: hypothetical protein JWR22_673 [Herminiimonas sp.]|nr:hypothetical protein [Herminiimonas sp.]
MDSAYNLRTCPGRLQLVRHAFWIIWHGLVIVGFGFIVDELRIVLQHRYFLRQFVWFANDLRDLSFPSDRE